MARMKKQIFLKTLFDYDTWFIYSKRSQRVQLSAFSRKDYRWYDWARISSSQDLSLLVLGLLGYVSFHDKKIRSERFLLRIRAGNIIEEATKIQASSGDRILGLDGMSLEQVACNTQITFISLTPERRYENGQICYWWQSKWPSCEMGRKCLHYSSC